MKERVIPSSHAKEIAECACDLADKVHHWKQRALAAEEALRKFAGEIYAKPGRSA